ncbi:hypothetical protein ACHQM5_017051 [Ranunculus cassubicifolius]
MIFNSILFVRKLISFTNSAFTQGLKLYIHTYSLKTSKSGINDRNSTNIPPAQPFGTCFWHLTQFPFIHICLVCGNLIYMTSCTSFFELEGTTIKDNYVIQSKFINPYNNHFVCVCGCNVKQSASS